MFVMFLVIKLVTGEYQAPPTLYLFQSYAACADAIEYLGPRFVKEAHVDTIYGQCVPAEFAGETRRASTK